MRLTKRFCALASSLALSASAPVIAQTPAPAPDTSTPSNDSLRDALRKALGTDGATPVTPATPSTPVAPAETPLTRPPLVNRPPVAPATNVQPFVAWGTNLVSTNITTLPLSLDQAILMALENNRTIKVERYTPIISEYDRRALYGYYDPVLTGEVGRQSTSREGGGFNQNTGQQFPAQTTEEDFANAGLGGYLPTGMRYDLGHTVGNTLARRPFLTGTNSFGQPVFQSGTSDTWDSTANVTVTQPLLRDFWIDSTRLQIKLAKRDVQITELAFERIVMDIINQVEQAYYGLIAARELIRVAESDYNVKKTFFEENRRRVEVGALAPLDEKLAQSEMALSEINLIVARNNAIDAETILKGLIYNNFVSDLNVYLQPTDKLLSLPPALDLYDAFREAVEKRPDLQVERLNLEKQNIQLKYTFNQLFPRLDLFGTWGLNGLDSNLSGALTDIRTREFDNDRYGLSLSVPLSMWAERNRHKSAKDAKARQIEALHSLEETVVQEVEFQVRFIRTTWNTLPLRREQITYREAAVEAEKRMLAAGKSTSFNVLQIASDLARAQSDEIEALRDYNQALSELAFRKGTTLERWRIDPPVRRNK
jgi:outer membrane protein